MSAIAGGWLVLGLSLLASDRPYSGGASVLASVVFAGVALWRMKGRPRVDL